MGIFLSLNLLCYALTATTTATTEGQQPATCPIDAVKLGVCANLLGGLVGVAVEKPPYSTTPCCSLLAGLVDLEAAVCLCTAIKANILGINLNVPVALTLVLNACGKTNPLAFYCA